MTENIESCVECVCWAEGGCFVARLLQDDPEKVGDRNEVVKEIRLKCGLGTRPRS